MLLSNLAYFERVPWTLAPCSLWLLYFENPILIIIIKSSGILGKFGFGENCTNLLIVEKGTDSQTSW